MNLGLRYEYEGATTRFENRNVRGFDPAAAISIAAPPRPLRGQPDSADRALAFNVRGGLQFASDGNPASTTPTSNNIQPRARLRVPLNDRTVVRGGVGIYTVPNIIFGNFQPGFSQARRSSRRSTIGPDLPCRRCATRSPDGVRIRRAPRSAPNTFLGRRAHRVVPLDFNNAQNTRYMVSVQRELPGQWLVEAAYAGSRGWDLTTGGGGQAGEIELNGVPAQYLSTSRTRDQAAIDFLTRTVPNPFAGLLPGTSFNGATVARPQLLRPYPQFDNIRTATSTAPAATTRRSSRSKNDSRRATRCWPPTRGRSSPSRYSS